MRAHLLVVGGWTEVLAAALDVAKAVSFVGPTDATAAFDPTILDSCAHVRSCDVSDLPRVVLAAVDVHRALPVTRIVCQTEYGLLGSAVAALTLGVPGPELLPVLRTRNKDLLRDLLAEVPELAVAHASARSADDVAEFAEHVGLPIIVKPPDGFAAVGVQQIRTHAQLDDFVEQHGQLEAPLLVEELVVSDDIYSIETQSADGVHQIVGYSYSRLVGHPHAIFNYTVVPPPAGKLPPETADAAARMARAVLDRIGMTHGSAHTEFKLWPDGRPALIESQTRVGGDRIWRMVAETTGTRQLQADCEGQLPPTVPGTRPGVRAFYSFVPPAGGIVEISGLDHLRADPSVLAVDVADDLFTSGVPPIRDNRQRPVQALLTAEDHAQLWQRLCRLVGQVTFVYADGRRWQAELPEPPYP